MDRSLVSALAVLASPLPAQSLLFRSPNLAGTWVPEAGVVQFNFLHRFYVGGAPTHSVVNFPTFTLAVGLPAHLGLRIALEWGRGPAIALGPFGCKVNQLPVAQQKKHFLLVPRQRCPFDRAAFEREANERLGGRESSG